MSKHNGLGTMTIGGKERPFQVESTRQAEEYTRHRGIELDQYWADLAQLSNGKVLTNKKLTLVFLWSALYAGAIRTARKCAFTYEDVVDWFEDADDEEAGELIKPFLLANEMIEAKKKQLQDEQPA